MRRFLTLFVLLCVSLSFARGLEAADEISGELVGLNVSLAAEKQLVVYEQLVAAEEWAAALEVLDRLQVDNTTVLVKVAPGRFVGLSVAIQQRLCQLPAAGLEVYRRRHSAAAAALLNRARLEHDSAALDRLVTDTAATPAGQSALQDLAAQAAARGDLERALRLWGRLIERRARESPTFPVPLVALNNPDPDQSRMAFSKAVIARHQRGVPLTEQEWAASGVDAAASKLAGRSVRELLAEWPVLPVSTSTMGALRWSTVATANCPLPEHQSPLSVVASRGGPLLINNGEQVRALNAGTGEPYWPTGLPLDVGAVFTDDSLNISSTRDLPYRIAGGVCSSDRYFGVVADAPRWRPRPGLIPLSGSLITLDLATGQGRLEWRVESRSLPEPEWLFHGAPLLARGSLPSEELVIVPLCRPAPQVELAVAAFSADDGHLVWFTRIGTCAAEAGEPLANTQLLVQGGLVVARTMLGVVVALDAQHGRVEWASTSLVSSPPEQRGSPASLIDCRAGVLVVGDPVQSRVAALSLDGGEVLWRQEILFPLQGVVCAPQGTVLIAGSRLRALSWRTGTPLWEHGFDDPAAAGTGTPLVEGETVWWPTRSGIWGVGLPSGVIEFERRLTASPVAAPMQLTQAGSGWFVALPDAILCLQRNAVKIPEQR